jgi:hypothetical protein
MERQRDLPFHVKLGTVHQIVQPSYRLFVVLGFYLDRDSQTLRELGIKPKIRFVRHGFILELVYHLLVSKLFTRLYFQWYRKESGKVDRDIPVNAA